MLGLVSRKMGHNRKSHYNQVYGRSVDKYERGESLSYQLASRKSTVSSLQLAGVIITLL